MKHYIITALYSIIYFVIFSPLGGMELEILDSKPPKFKSLFKNNNKYDLYKKEILKMSKTARRNCNFVYIQDLIRAMYGNQEINKIIKTYKKNKVADNSIIKSRAMSDLESVNELLAYNRNVHDPEYISTVVKKGSLGLLKGLKKNQKVKFNNRELMPIALETEELGRINFVLDQQESNDLLPKYEVPYDKILKLVPKTCKLDIFNQLDLADEDKEFQIAREMYMHLLNVREGNIEFLERFVFNFDNDMQQLNEVHVPFEFDKNMLKENGEKPDYFKMLEIIRDRQYPEGVNDPFELNSNAVNNIKTIISRRREVLKKYKKFSEGLIQKKWELVEKCKFDLAKKALKEYELHRWRLRGLNALMEFFSGILFTGTYGPAPDKVWKAAQAEILPLALYTGKLYAYFKERNKKYLSAENLVTTCKNISYLDGYICGLLTEKAPIENLEKNLQEQYYEKNLYQRNLIAESMSVIMLPQFFLFPIFCMIGVATQSFSMKCFALTIFLLPILIDVLNLHMLEEAEDYYSSNLRGFLNCVYGRGLRDGWVQSNGNQFQLNQQQQPEFGESPIVDPLPETKRGIISIATSIAKDFCKPIFGIIRYSKNLFGGFMSRTSKYTIRNPERK